MRSWNSEAYGYYLYGPFRFILLLYSHSLRVSVEAMAAMMNVSIAVFPSLYRLPFLSLFWNVSLPAITHIRSL
jgi:hypothetical protein